MATNFAIMAQPRNLLYEMPGVMFIITETSPYSFGNFHKLSLYNCFMPI